MIGESDATTFHAAIEMSLIPIVLSDPHQDDVPVIFANAAFCEMTGYRIDEIIGRNCRLLQGPDTDREAVRRIRAGVAARWNVSEELVNYRKDGSAFRNALFVNPIFDQGGKLIYLFGTQLDVTRQRSLESVLRSSHELLSVVEARVVEALASPMSLGQRASLDKALQAIREVAVQQVALLSNARGGHG
jgi:PAS domain S-box-containing protein